MAAHACWATIVLWSGREKELRSFHRLSLVVWLLWLIPYITGIVLNSGLIHQVRAFSLSLSGGASHAAGSALGNMVQWKRIVQSERKGRSRDI